MCKVDAHRESAPLNLAAKAFCFMTQMLWEKAIRWYMLGHASFLAMTAFAVSYKTLAQIPKYPPGSFSNSSYLSRRWSELFESQNLNMIVGSINRICASIKVRAKNSLCTEEGLFMKAGERLSLTG